MQDEDSIEDFLCKIYTEVPAMPHDVRRAILGKGNRANDVREELLRICKDDVQETRNHALRLR